MKILIILNDLDIGGAQNYTVALMNQFVELGHDVRLIVLSEDLSLKSRLSADVKLWVWEKKFKMDLIVLNKLRREVGKGNYDGVISSYILYQKMATLCMSHTPITLYPIHSTIDRDLKSYIINFLLFRLKSRHERFITSIDSQTHYLCKKHLLGSGFFDQIYNGIDTVKFSVVPDQFSRNEFLETIGVPVNHRVILMVAGFREEKRHIDALSSLKHLREVMKNVTLICVGDNRSDERNKLQAYINDNGIEGVKLLVASEAGDVKNYYWSADMFTLTSNKVETFPISVLEAMACGLPCVLTDTGGAKDIIINQKFGRVVPVENIKAIAEAWNEVLQSYNTNDKDFIKTYSQLYFQIKTSANQYINLIQNIHAN